MRQVEQLTPIKAIRAKCLDCSGYETTEVRLCESYNCPLYLYRMNRKPKSEDYEDLEYKLEMRYNPKKLELAKEN